MSGRHREARRSLDRLVGRAREAGREDVAIMAELRGLYYDHLVYRFGPARSYLIDLANSNDPARRLHALGAKVLLARIYRAEGDAQRDPAVRPRGPNLPPGHRRWTRSRRGLRRTAGDPLTFSDGPGRRSRVPWSVGRDRSDGDRGHGVTVARSSGYAVGSGPTCTSSLPALAPEKSRFRSARSSGPSSAPWCSCASTPRTNNSGTH